MTPRDPDSRDMRAQRQMLRGLADADVSRTTAACILADALGGSIEYYRTHLGRCAAGKATLSAGWWILLLRGVEPSERLAMERTATRDMDLRIELETWGDDDPADAAPGECAARGLDLVRQALQAAMVVQAERPTDGVYQELADACRWLDQACTTARRPSRDVA